MGWDNIGQLMMAGLLSMAFVLYILKNNWRRNAFILLLAICVILPIMPVASTLYSRYLFLFSFVYFIGIGLGLQYLCEAHFLRTFKTEMVVIIAVVSIMVSVFHVQKNIRGWQAYGKEISAEGKFLLYNNDPNNLLVTAHGHCYWAFSALRKTVLGLPQGASYCIRDCICPFLYPDKQVWVNINGQLFKYSGEMEKETPENCGDKRELKIDFSYTNGKLKWQFGPYREGKYSIYLNGWDSGLIQVKREREIDLDFDLENGYIIVKYESYEGCKTYSPVLKFNGVSSHNGRMNWRR